MALNTKSRILFVADNCGLLNLIDIKTSETISKRGLTLVVIELMNQGINTIELFNNDTMLLASGDSKSCGIYKLPSQYFIDDLPLQKQIIAKKTKTGLEAQKQAAVDKMEERVRKSQQGAGSTETKPSLTSSNKPQFESDSSEESDSDEDIVVKKKKLAANKYGGKAPAPVVQKPLPISQVIAQDSDEDVYVAPKPQVVPEIKAEPVPQKKPATKKKVFVGGNSSDSDDSDDN